MAKLTTDARNKLSGAQFAGPDRSYPVPDREHAALAKSYSTKAVQAGRMSAAMKSRIDAKANRVLGMNKLKEPKR